MKKIFVFAIAAATMAVGCQKLQGVLVNPNNPSVDENEPVEIKFSAASATVATKAAVETLKDLDLYVYGLNKNSGNREITGAKATWTADAEYLTLEGGPYYYNNNDDVYHFYGYYLGGLTANLEGYATTVEITGQNDILLAAALTNADGDEYTAKNARDKKVYPHLEFKHALSQLTFGAVNLGNTQMTLSKIVVKTPLKGNVIVAGDGQSATATGEPSDLPVWEQELTLQPGEIPSEGEDYPSVGATPVMVFANATYEFYITVGQTNLSRTLKVSLPTGSTILPGYSYAININLYSLEEIKISAELKDWEYLSYTVDTEEAEEVKPGA